MVRYRCLNYYNKKYINNQIMTEQEQPTVILDANAFITGAGLLDIATKNKLVTTPAVMDELRDPKTRDMLEKFVFTIHQVEPDKKSVEFIRDFARKTGDLTSLSDVDVDLLALAHTLYIRKGLADKLRKTPPPLKQKEDQNKLKHEYEEEQQEYFDEQLSQENQNVIDHKNEQTLQQNIEKMKLNSENGLQSVKEDQKDVNIQHKYDKQIERNKQQQSKTQEGQDDGWIVVPTKHKKQKVESDDELGEEQGWITPNNFDRKMAEGTTATFQNQSDEQEKDEKQISGISLMTADFAMQNVAIQVGIELKSLDGRQIKQIRRFILQCYLCWKQYKVDDNQVKLCKECGYNSLSKIAYSITPDGEMILHRKKGWKPNQKVLEWKERKYEEQQKKKKHQHARRKKQASIFDV